MNLVPCFVDYTFYIHFRHFAIKIRAKFVIHVINIILPQITIICNMTLKIIIIKLKTNYFYDITIMINDVISVYIIKINTFLFEWIKKTQFRQVRMKHFQNNPIQHQQQHSVSFQKHPQVQPHNYTKTPPLNSLHHH